MIRKQTYGWALACLMAMGAALAMPAVARADDASRGRSHRNDSDRGRDGGRFEGRRDDDRRDHDRRDHDRRDYGRHDRDRHDGRFDHRDRDDHRPKFQIHVAPRFPAPPFARHYVSGAYITRHEKVLVKAGHYNVRHVPAVYQTCYDRFGRPYQVMVREACQERFWVEPCYETRAVQVWVPGHYQTVAVPAPLPPPAVHVQAHFRF